jgi:hypothetical protein
MLEAEYNGEFICIGDMMYHRRFKKGDNDSVEVMLPPDIRIGNARLAAYAPSMLHLLLRAANGISIAQSSRDLLVEIQKDVDVSGAWTEYVIPEKEKPLRKNESQIRQRRILKGSS